jgi:CheY-like chemotaxis protein
VRQRTLNRCRLKFTQAKWAVAQTDRAMQPHAAAMPILSNSLQHVAASVRQALPRDFENTDVQVLADNPWRVSAIGAGLEPARVLIVDDVQSTLSLELLLHGLGYWKTQVAVSGATALQMAQNFVPSVVLLALELPDMSAYEVARRLRERTELRRVRLIALTDDYEHASRDMARQAGFERYLAKPVSAADLQGLLRADLS